MSSLLPSEEGKQINREEITTEQHPQTAPAEQTPTTTPRIFYNIPTSFSEADEAWIAANVKSLNSKNWMSVGARDEKTLEPTVLIMYPLRVADRKHPKKKHLPNARVPWVNMCWLVSEDIIRRVGLLETSGWIAKLQHRLESDPSSMQVSLSLFLSLSLDFC